VLETLYNIYSPNATLTIASGGRVFLHQNDWFGAMIVNGAHVANGVYSYAQLAAAYPSAFPASWTSVYGSTFSQASGSITVGPPTVTLQFQFSADTLKLTWSQGTLLQATNLLGPWITDAAASSPYTVAPTNAQLYFKVLVEP
jgi:hypothetical protein